ncbi:type VI secretion system tip protein VgrG [Vibrio sp. SM6]|uniref:Type VI secretion system tip protein VgrG n=1 Tax=Vibrio agarilyticus TaxID=2726741 RepID=A0A7X8TPF4_9VIBR|nr:type VI secretion system tip protein TssI/VgrG [Vibrio agarilyticus]NLS11788.1 type VI secretion system tip protein VgrG [Vibrio agarilyticus]
MRELIDPQGSLLVIRDANNKEYVASNFSGSEGVSGDYQWQVHALVTSVDPSLWVGERIECQLFDETGSGRNALRSFRGYVIKAQSQSARIDSPYASVCLTVKPWLYLLQHSRRCRVFQAASVQTIVTSIFDELGFKGCYSVNAMPSSKREYCVQFNETDFEFITRLLAEEGVHYYFGRNDDANTLYLHQANKPFPNQNLVTLDYAAAPTGQSDVLFTWQREQCFISSASEITGYDYNQSKLVTSKSKKTGISHANHTKLVDYRYPTASRLGNYSDLANEMIETVRGQADSEHERIQATTESELLCAGHKLKLAAHPDSKQLGQYLVCELSYQFDDTSGRLHTDIIAVAEDAVFYPVTKAKPVLHGVQSATVSGSAEGEPANDALGRVRIKFHWDNETGDKTSCWVRVAQTLAGKSYGAQFLPRAGQEVLVSFINGDPDQPIVVSSVYNSGHKPPYPTANTTQSGVRSQLAGQKNEWRFDDKKENELFALHAAKDMTCDVINDHQHTVGGELIEKITKNRSQTIEQKSIVTAKAGFDFSTDKTFSLAAKEAITQQAKTITLTAEDTLTLKVGNSKIVMSSDKIELVSGTVQLSGSSKIALDGGSLSQSGSSVSISSQGGFTGKAGTAMTLSASTSFTAKGSTGAKLQGLNAEVKGDVTAKVSGAAQAEVSSSGQTAIKGTILMVN